MSDAIVRLAARGDGVTADGRFVALAAPGDLVDGQGAVVAAGPHRALPPCGHFPECGGCQLQHVDDATYAGFVVDRIAGALAAAGVAAGAIDPPHLSPPRSRRRASLRAVRQGRRVAIGFNAAASHRIVDMRECHVLTPRLFALVAPLRTLLAPLLRDGQGGGVMLTDTDEGVDLLLSNVAADGLAAIESLSGFAEANDLARLSVEGAGGVDVLVERRAPTLRLGGVDVALPPAPFLQATRDGEAALQRAVLGGVGAASTVVDLFAGVGTFALPLSRAARVHAADAAGPAVAALGAAAREAGRPVTVEHRDLFRNPLRAAELSRFDAVVIDPPRAGAAAQVAELVKSGVSRVIAVSCNPATFARDAAALAAGGFRIERIAPVGQFRWSIHVELAAMLLR